ncbi:MAG: prepilin-type N-terminal cleavage/methylation domain-containing protein [Verrucomicrobiia bacterium]
MNIYQKRKQILSNTVDCQQLSPGFTLIEVMIALAIFFMATFAILGVVSRGISAARHLHIVGPDPSLITAELTVTNKLEDGMVESGDFGDMYPDYSWSYEVYEVATNGLFKVDIKVLRKSGYSKQEDSKMSILIYKPDAKGSRLSTPGLSSPTLGPRR